MRKKSWSDINNSHLNAPISRLLLISYFPSGFWSRLMIRILADTQIGEIAQSVYEDSTAEVSRVIFCLVHFILILMRLFSAVKSNSNTLETMAIGSGAVYGRHPNIQIARNYAMRNGIVLSKCRQ